METFRDYNKGRQRWDRLGWNLKRKYGTIRQAAQALKVSYWNLSRIIHGKPHELAIHIKILIALGDLPAKKYIYPKEDLVTFKLLNKI